ncbi:MAG: hypothetical protein IJS53_04740 [Clostridia bacterium]|nr:hypothetical protein [Clostridia bacterium]
MERATREILALLRRMETDRADRRRQLRAAFLSGVLRGVGHALGFALAGAAMIALLRPLAQANLPVISDFLAQVVTLVQLRMQ